MNSRGLKPAKAHAQKKKQNFPQKRVMSEIYFSRLFSIDVNAQSSAVKQMMGWLRANAYGSVWVRSSEANKAAAAVGICCQSPDQEVEDTALFGLHSSTP